MTIKSFDPQIWMFEREREALNLIDKQIEPYHIQSQDSQIEITGTMLFNAISARLSFRLYNNDKIPFEKYEFIITSFQPIANHLMRTQP